MSCAILYALLAASAPEALLTLDTVTERLSAPEVLRGRYSQTREVAVLSRPLYSSGSFILSDRGLYWEQQKPFRSVLIADGDRLAQRIADGPLTRIDSSEYPMVLSFSKIFLNIFRGEHEDLETHFFIEFDTHDDAWEIGLTPSGELLSGAIENIVLTGQGHIEEITVTGSSSDTMTIRFSELRTSPATLTEHEIELYAW